MHHTSRGGPAARRAIQRSGDLGTWQVQGACRSVDASVFFPPEGERGAARAIRDAAAKSLCSACRVVVECREHALGVPEPHGVWGGTSAEERAEILHPRRAVTTPPLPPP